MNTNLLTPAQTAETFGVTIATLAVWRCAGRYPLLFVRLLIVRVVRVSYRSAGLKRFLAAGKTYGLMVRYPARKIRFGLRRYLPTGEGCLAVFVSDNGFIFTAYY